MSLDFSTGGENATPVLDEDDPARSRKIDVTVLYRARPGISQQVFQFISGHTFSSPERGLGEHVVRTQVSSETFLLLHVPKYREKVMKKILLENP